MKTIFPAEIEAKTFRMRREYTWQKKDLEHVFDFCSDDGIPILSGETWVVWRIDELSSNEPYEPQHIFDSNYRQDVSVLGRTATCVICGIFPFCDGTNGVFSWDTTPRGSNQSWQDYLNASIEETRVVIRKGDIEEAVIPYYSEDIFYNLVLATANSD